VCLGERSQDHPRLAAATLHAGVASKDLSETEDPRPLFLHNERGSAPTRRSRSGAAHRKEDVITVERGSEPETDGVPRSR
jgi:hypothetical protein